MKLTRNKLSMQHQLKLAFGNFMERKWRNLVIALATSIGFIGIIISFGLGNAVLTMINQNTGNGKLPSQIQISLNAEVIKTGNLNKNDMTEVQKLVGKDKIKYLEAPFSVMMSSLDIKDLGNLRMTESLPNYSQVVSLYRDTSISVVANDADEIVLGKEYTDADEQGLTIPVTLIEHFNKANKTNYHHQDFLGKEVTLQLLENSATDTKTGTIKTIISRIIKDELGDSNSFMAPNQLAKAMETNGFTKTIPYLLLEAKNPEDTAKISDKIKKNKKYLVISQQAILDIVINVIKIAQGLLIVLSLQAVLVSIVMIGVIVYINIMQRSREIGVMKAVGYLNKDVKAIFLLESLLITFISLLFAFVISLAIGGLANTIVNHFYKDIERVFALNWQSVLGMILLAFTMGYLSAYFPTKNISKLDPVESLRYE